MNLFELVVCFVCSYVAGHRVFVALANGTAAVFCRSSGMTLFNFINQLVNQSVSQSLRQSINQLIILSSVTITF